MKKILLLFIAFFTVTSYVFAAEDNTKNPYEKNAKSIAVIETQAMKGIGAIVSSDGTFVTSFHTVSNADYINLKTFDNKIYKVNGYKYLNPELDIAVLTVQNNKKQQIKSKPKRNSRSNVKSNQIRFNFFKVSDTDELKLKEEIYAVSNNENIQYIKTAVSKLVDDKIQFTIPVSQNVKGGIILSSEGEFIGIINPKYSSTKTLNTYSAYLSSKVVPYLTGKSKINSKNLPWSEFVSAELTGNELNAFVDYAEKSDNISMLFKYYKQYAKRGEIPSYRYPLMGTLAISGFLDGNALDEALLSDSIRWFALAINSGKNLEASSYGLFFATLLNNNSNDFAFISSYMKKYPATEKTATKNLIKLMDCNDNSICVKKTFFSMCKYLQMLTGKGY